MWDEVKQTRLNALRAKEDQGLLPPQEEHELEGLYAQLDADEGERLHSALERMDREALELEQRNPQLATLVERNRRLLERMRSGIAEWADEREELRRDEAVLVKADQPG